MLKTLADADNYPVVFHCQGGKGRTSVISAIVEKTIGYSDYDIMRDFLTSNVYYYDKLEKNLSTKMPSSLKRKSKARSNWINASFMEINKR